MRMTSDYHTHTTYTHGKGNVEDNIRQAVTVGLKQIAITEHSYNSVFHIRKGDLQKIKQDIDNAKEKFDIDILWGIEANLISKNGDIDISDEELSRLDLVVLGFHKHSRVGIKTFFNFVLPNILGLSKKSKKGIERNTNAYIRAMDKHRINILAHLNYGGCQVNIEKIATECVKRNILIELNGKRISFTENEIDTMIRLGVKFVVNSDAHNPMRVGRNHRAFNLIEKYKIPLNQIVNIYGKTLKFK